MLAWTFRGVSFREVWEEFRAAHPLPLIAAVLLTTSTFVLRLFRWRLLLYTDAHRAVAYPPLWHAIAVGFMANNLLPLRAGEVIRAFSVTRLAPVRMTAALSSLVVERLLDGFIIVGLLLFAILRAGIPGDATIAGVRVAHVASRTGLLCGALLGVAFLMLAFPAFSERMVRRLVAAPRLADRIVKAIEGVRHGMGALTSPGRIAASVFWSLAVWVVNGLSFYVAFLAFEIPVGVPGALLLQSLLVLGIAVPSSPGFFGVFEAVIKAVLAIFGVASGPAVSYALTYHITTFIPITLLGLWSLSRTPIELRAVREAGA